MNWTDLIVGGLIGAFVVNIFWGIQLIRDVSRDTNYFSGLMDGSKIADQLIKIAKLLEKEQERNRG